MPTTLPARMQSTSPTASALGSYVVICCENSLAGLPTGEDVSTEKWVFMCLKGEVGEVGAEVGGLSADDWGRGEEELVFIEKDIFVFEDGEDGEGEEGVCCIGSSCARVEATSVIARPDTSREIITTPKESALR